MNKLIAIIIAFFSLCFYSVAQTNLLVVNGPDTVCAGTSGSLTLTNISGTVDHWAFTTNGGATWVNGVGTSVNQTFFMIPQTTCYVVILNGGADTSNMACVIVDQPSSSGTVSGGGNFCTTGSGTLAVNGNTGTSLGWFVSSSGSAWSSTGNVNTTHAFGPDTVDTWYKFCTQNGVCPVKCDSELVNIDSPSVAGAITPPFSVCASGNADTILLSGATGSVIAWASSADSGATWNIDTTNNSTSNPFSNLTQTTQYMVVVQNGVCAPDTALTTVTVDVPGVGGSVSGGSVFCGTPGSGVLTLSGYTGIISSWRYSLDNGLTWNGIANTNNTYSYSGVTQTTLFQAVIGTGGCPVVYSQPDTVFYFSAALAGVMSVSDTICAGQNGDTLTVTGSAGSAYEWFMSSDGGANWISLGNNSAYYVYNNLSSTTLFVGVAFSGPCSPDTSNIIMLDVVPVTPVAAGADTVINLGQSYQLSATPGGPGSIVWAPSFSLSSDTVLNPVASPTVTTFYTVTITDANGCYDTDGMLITVLLNEFDGIIANTLTANGDDLNDSWYIEGIENYDDNEVKVFNEYGMEVYAAAPYKNDWKGTFNSARLPDGVYYYVLKFNKSGKVYKGTINLLSN